MASDFYHLFKYHYRRKNGTKYFYWWYWWYDPDTGRQMKKPAGRAQTVKKRAQEYIDSLPEPVGSGGTVRAVASPMFVPGSAFLRRREEKNSSMAQGTWRTYAGFVKNHILPDWGDMPITRVEGDAIEDWLLEKDLKNSTRNSIIDCWNFIFKEAKRQKKLRNIPMIERFSRNSDRYDTFRLDELELLFPWEKEKLIDLYLEEEDGQEQRKYGLMFAVMLLTAVSGGLRSGEVRALYRDQVFLKQKGIVVNKSLNLQNEDVLPKKGSAANPKFRAIPLPGRTMEVLGWWMDQAPPSGHIFKYQGQVVDRKVLLQRLHTGMTRAKIEPKGRKLAVHSLRYTYNTKMETLLSEERLLQFMGHESRKMTIHYSRPYWQERLLAFKDDQKKLEKFWN
jgi:integrase